MVAFGTFGARVAALVVVLGLTACGATGDGAEPSGESRPSVGQDTSTTAATAFELDQLDGELIVTRQRDLLDRGRINVRVHNGSGRAITLTDRRLIADFFTSQPAERRTAEIDSGRRLALQVPYGTVEDCETDRPVAASFAFTYVTADDDGARRGRIPIGGTDILDGIRNKQCATQAFGQEAAWSLDEVEVVGETVVAQLTVEKTGGGQVLQLGGVRGTILVAVRAADGYENATLARAGDRVAIPVRFVVNRCDPHALAEVTKRFGFDIDVAVGDREPVPVSIDITDIEDELEEIVRRCRVESSTGDA